MMRLLLATAFLLAAVAGSAFAEGRYQTAIAPASDEWPNIIQIVITDTHKGAVKYCFAKQKGGDFQCSYWQPMGAER